MTSTVPPAACGETQVCPSPLGWAGRACPSHARPCSLRLPPLPCRSGRAPDRHDHRLAHHGHRCSHHNSCLKKLVRPGTGGCLEVPHTSPGHGLLTSPWPPHTTPHHATPHHATPMPHHTTPGSSCSRLLCGSERPSGSHPESRPLFQFPSGLCWRGRAGGSLYSLSALSLLSHSRALCVCSTRLAPCSRQPVCATFLWKPAYFERLALRAVHLTRAWENRGDVG